MSLVTQTQTVTDTATTVVPADTTITDVTTTITSHFYTTLTATHGQTVTISSPLPPAPPAAPTTKYTPIIATTTETSSVTLTEIDVYLQNDHGRLYSTLVISLPVLTAMATISEPPTPLIYVVEPQQQQHGGWDGWSTGAKVGLIVGSVLAGLLLLSLLFWCCKRRKIWVVHGWPWSTSAHVSVAPRPHPGSSVVPPTFVDGPVLPYNNNHHGQAAYGYG